MLEKLSLYIIFYIQGLGSDSYYEVPHGLNVHPALVISRTGFYSPSLDPYSDSYSDSVG